MLNEYGLDQNYFEKELEFLLQTIDRRFPEEVYRYLNRIANVACHSIDKPQKWFVMRVFEGSVTPVLIPTTQTDDGMFTDFDSCLEFYKRIFSNKDIHTKFWMCSTIN